MKIKLFFIVLFLESVVGFSQEIGDNTNIIPKSPEISNLGRYGDVQVGEYTGKPSINIPLYNILTGDLQFPLNLYYDATGIRVGQEATWVGLGWELSTVAAITYMTIGKDDRSSINHVNHVSTSPPWSLYEVLINDIIYENLPYMGYGGDMTEPYAGFAKYRMDGSLYTHSGCYVGVNTNNNTEFDNIIVRSLEGQVQTDYFQINCPGLSGSFYIHPGTGEIKAYGEKNKYKISHLAYHYGFEIITEEGLKYIFTTKELNPSQDPNAWFLTEIRSLKSNHWIKFKYNSFGEIDPIISFSEQLYSGYYPAGNNPNKAKLSYNPDTVIEPLYLTEIETDLEIVSFNLNAFRDDIQGVGKRKLQSIDIKNKAANDINSWRHFEFSYNYFNGVGLGGDYYKEDPFIGAAHTTPDYFKKRLKLLGVTESVGVSGSNAKVHSFEYNTTPLPYKTSFAKDFWGFYNGENNDTFIPNLVALLAMDYSLRNIYLNSYESLFKKYFDDDIRGKANRGTNEVYLKAGTLTAINYPTGGRSEFSYESHTFSNQTILSSEEEEEVIASNSISYFVYDNGSSSATQQVDFELTEDTWVKISGNINNRNGEFSCSEMASTGFKVFRVGGYPIPAESVGITSKTYSFDCTYGQQNPPGSGIYVHSQPIEDEILLAPGVYLLYAYSGAPFNNPSSWDPSVVTAQVKVNRLQTNLDEVVDNHQFSIGGGLRITEFTNFDSNGSFINKKKYSYDGGVLMSKLNMFRTLAYSSNGLPRHTGIRYMNSSINSTTGTIGATVGYRKVTIEQVDNDSFRNGRTEKYFNNFALSPKFSIINHISDDSLLNGSIDSIAYYNNSNTIVKKETFEYNIFESESNFVNIVSQLNYNVLGEDVFNGAVNTLCEENPTITIHVYPYSSSKGLLTKRRTIDYLEGEELEQTISYDYNLDNYLPSKQTIVNSRNQEITTEYEYPTNYASYGVYPYNIMVSEKNWLTPKITQTQKIDNIITNKSSVAYNGFGQVIAPSYISESKGNQSLERIIEYENYDSNGNILEYNVKNGIHTVYIWGYKEQFPIAKIDNATSAQVTAALSSLDPSYDTLLELQSLSNSDNDRCLDSVTVPCDEKNLRTALNALRNALPSAMVTTYTYDPLIGVTSTTDPKGYTVYYEYDGFNRLEQVIDAEGHILSENEYNYKQ